MTVYAGPATGIDYTKYLEQEDYYFKKDDGNIIHGEGPQAQAIRRLKSLNQKAVFAKYAEGRNGKQRKLYATELVFSPPKTTSFASMCKNEQVRKIAIKAHHSAVKEVMEEIENHHFFARKKEHGRQVNYKATGMIAVEFVHMMNRDGEPQTHSHVLICNSGLIPGENQTRSINFDSVYKNQMKFDQIYKAKLQYEFEISGIQTENDTAGISFEIAGINRAKVLAKSSRTLQVERETRKLLIAQFLNNHGYKTQFTPEGVNPKGRLREDRLREFIEARSIIEKKLEGQNIRKISTAEQRRVGAQMYRKSKRSLDQKEARMRIEKELEELGVDIKIQEKLPEPKPEKVKTLVHKGYQNYIHNEGISNRSGAVKDIFEFVTMARNKDNSLPIITLGDINKFLPDAMKKEEMVRLPGQMAGREEDRELLVSKKLLRADAENQQYLIQGKDRYTHLDRSSIETDLQTVIDNGLFSFKFEGEQRTAALGVLGSKDFICGVQGNPGTGKMRVMRAIVAIQKSGSFIAVSKTAVDADRLGQKIGVQVHTIDRFCIDYDTRKAIMEKGALNRREMKYLKDTEYINNLSGSAEKPGMIIVGEASMASDLDINRLLKIGDETNSKIILTGDMRQPPGVGVGESFIKFLESRRMETWELKGIYHQKDEEYKIAVEAVTIAKNIRTAVQILKSNPDSLVEIESDRDRVDKIQYDYINFIKEGKNPILITGRNSDRHELNEGLRKRLKKIGRLDNKGETHTVMYDTKRKIKEIELCINDRIVFLENDHHNKIETSTGEEILNGSQGIITGIKNGNITGYLVDVENRKLEGSFSFPIQDYNRIDWSFASSVHKSQMKSVSQPVMYHAPSDSNLLSKTEMLVGISRNEFNVLIYTNNSEEMVKKASSWVKRKDALQTYEAGINTLEKMSPKVDHAVRIARDKLAQDDALSEKRQDLIDQYGTWGDIPKKIKKEYNLDAEASRKKFHLKIKTLRLINTSEFDTKNEFNLSKNLDAWQRGLDASEKRYRKDNSNRALTNHLNRISKHDSDLCHKLITLRINEEADRQSLQDYEQIKQELQAIKSETIFKTEAPEPIKPATQLNLEEFLQEDTLKNLLARRQEIIEEILSLQGELSNIQQAEVFAGLFTMEEINTYQHCIKKIDEFDQRYNDLQEKIDTTYFEIDKVVDKNEKDPALGKLEERIDALRTRQADIANRWEIYEMQLTPLEDRLQDAYIRQEKENEQIVEQLLREKEEIEHQLADATETIELDDLEDKILEEIEINSTADDPKNFEEHESQSSIPPDDHDRFPVPPDRKSGDLGNNDKIDNPEPSPESVSDDDYQRMR